MDTWDVSRSGLVLIVNILMVRQVGILRPKLALLQKCFGASHCGWRGVSRSEAPGRRRERRREGEGGGSVELED